MQIFWILINISLEFVYNTTALVTMVTGGFFSHHLNYLKLLMVYFTDSSVFPSQRPVTRSFGVFFDLRPNKRLSKQSRHQWFETPSSSLWHHCNDLPTSRHFDTETPCISIPRTKGKLSRGRWLEMPSHSLWRLCNDTYAPFNLSVLTFWSSINDYTVEVWV